ncbi:M3 family metallopeptidase [Limibaculum sp. M0105]|uniref:M3 family metallopeptidase n=1 Tax=Thermohalobaculum xanthum TaxID=2753746 RepID=A0A8J7SJW4_9RHOB|nr:M3 family metallopeptidase [Thermohalobaculum xanthum]MBK0401240.1 M3 family metallopeptidase [Thermohalobaculum xanthum]
MTNPLLDRWDTPFGLPPFDAIEPAHFAPAFEAAMAEHLAEVEAIATDPAAPDFTNTIEALERAGRALSQVGAVFWNLCGSHTNPELQAIEREMAPLLSQHHSRVMLDERLFRRVEAIAPERLDAESARVLDLYTKMFVRAGARLDVAGKARMREIMSRLATLGTEFSQNVLKDESDWVMFLGPDDLDGLPGFLVKAARAEAETRGREGYAVTLSRSSVEPFLTFSTRRDLRERAWRAWVARGEATNWPLVAEMVRLRVERARLLGFPDFASFKLADQMAKTPEAVRELLMRVWKPARAKAAEEAASLEALAAAGGAEIEIAPWDWRHYAEALRKRLHDLDEAETKPYLALDSVIAAAFDVAGRLFGLGFTPVEGLTLHHPDARAWEVTRADGSHLGLFIGDYFARPSKRSGAWMSALRGQQGLWEPGRPIILNTCNFAKADPALLTWDDARTLFHEFGHALHGLMSDVRYPFIAGTSVARDFVELPSQLYEHWLSVPDILAAHARHVETGEPMPADLIARIKGAETFNQGFATVEYVASALVDLEMHTLTDAGNFDPESFQAEVLERIGMPPGVVMRHATPHFQHVFAGDGYSAGYYSYMWSEVMDADAFRAFEETGDPFDPGTAARLARHVLSAGGSRPPEDAYTAFRGQLPGPEALLEGRGLVEAGQVAKAAASH